MAIAIFFIFLAGIGNFAMHRAFMASDDPLIAEMVRPLAERVGPYVTYVFEFLLLLGAMALALSSWFIGLTLYGLYTMCNAMAFAWIMHRPR